LPGGATIAGRKASSMLERGSTMLDAYRYVLRMIFAGKPEPLFRIMR
jgi:hypothetical protein